MWDGHPTALGARLLCVDLLSMVWRLRKSTCMGTQTLTLPTGLCALGPRLQAGGETTSPRCPPPVRGPRFLPLLLSRNVQRVHDEADCLCNLLGPDGVLLKFGLYRRLGDALLEQVRGAR